MISSIIGLFLAIGLMIYLVKDSKKVQQEFKEINDLSREVIVQNKILLAQNKLLKELLEKSRQGAS